MGGVQAESAPKVAAKGGSPPGSTGALQKKRCDIIWIAIGVLWVSAGNGSGTPMFCPLPPTEGWAAQSDY